MQQISRKYPKSKGLKRRIRWGETIIQTVLFLSGFFSIFITVGIVYELGKESMLFFTKRQLENTNKVLGVGVGPDTTELRLEEGGRSINEGELIRFGFRGEELMRVVAVGENFVTVERGVEGTEPQAHEGGIEIYAATRVTLREFFTGTKWQPLFERIRLKPRTQYAQTDPGSPGRHSHYRVRVFCPHLYDTLATNHIWTRGGTDL